MPVLRESLAGVPRLKCGAEGLGFAGGSTVLYDNVVCTAVAVGGVKFAADDSAAYAVDAVAAFLGV